MVNGMSHAIDLTGISSIPAVNIGKQSELTGKEFLNTSKTDSDINLSRNMFTSEKGDRQPELNDKSSIQVEKYNEKSKYNVYTTQPSLMNNTNYC